MPSGPVTKLGGARHEQASSSCGELHMVMVTDAIICHKPDKEKPGNLGAFKKYEFGRNQGGLPGRGGFWMDYLRVMLKGGVAWAGVHCLLLGPGLPLTNLGPPS